MKRVAFLIILALFLQGCGSQEEPLPTGPDVSDELPAGTVIGSGDFESYAHSLMGKAVLYAGEGGKKVVRLENFSMTEGPDVFVFLSKTNNYSAANVLEVVRLTTGYNMSEINFEFESNKYSSDYKFVLVYCVQFHSLFGVAELK